MRPKRTGQFGLDPTILGRANAAHNIARPKKSLSKYEYLAVAQIK